MVTKNRKQTTGKKQAKRGRVQVGKLKLNKETVKDLTGAEAKRIKGGGATYTCADTGIVLEVSTHRCS